MHSRYVFIALSLLGVATPARAELVFFASGRTLNVKSHRSENGSLVLTLRSGGKWSASRRSSYGLRLTKHRILSRKRKSA